MIVVGEKDGRRAVIARVRRRQDLGSKSERITQKELVRAVVRCK